MEKESGIQNEIIEGRNAVMEALRAGRAMDKLYISKGEVDRTLGHIASTARDKGIVVVECDRRKLDFMSRAHAHQGVIALAAVRETMRVAILYALGYLFEHREEADHHALTLTLRSLLFGIREGVV